MEFISIEEAKNYLRVDFDDDDELIVGFICASLEFCENHLQQCFDELYLTKEELPKSIKQAAFFMLSHFYENRIAVSSVKMTELPLGVKALLDPHREHPFT